MPPEYGKTVSVRMTEEELSLMHEMMKREGVTNRSAFVREAILLFIEYGGMT